MSSIRLRDNQRQTKACNRHLELVITVIVICHRINKCLLSADRFNKNAPIIQMLITGSTRRGAELIYRLNRLRAGSLRIKCSCCLEKGRPRHKLPESSPSDTEGQPVIYCLVCGCSPSFTQPRRIKNTLLLHYSDHSVALSEITFAGAIYLSGKHMNDGLTLA